MLDVNAKDEEEAEEGYEKLNVTIDFEEILDIDQG